MSGSRKITLPWRSGNSFGIVNLAEYEYWDNSSGATEYEYFKFESSGTFIHCLIKNSRVFINQVYRAINQLLTASVVKHLKEL